MRMIQDWVVWFCKGDYRKWIFFLFDGDGCFGLGSRHAVGLITGHGRKCFKSGISFVYPILSLLLALLDLNAYLLSVSLRNVKYSKKKIQYHSNYG